MDIPQYLSSGEIARLIPVAADSNKEVRAASILLATIMNVTPFAGSALGSVGQRVGARSMLECYTEVVFKDGPETSKTRPDGLIVLEGTGNRQWRCLVEAKIGRAELEVGQIERYLALAKHQKIDAVLTISNQFVALPSHPPVKVPKSATRGVELFHWSWTYLVTEAMLLLSNHEFERPEQRFVLSEMVRYFMHPSVGVSTFDRMNADWKDLNSQIQAGAKLNKTAAVVENSVAAWHQEARDLSLLLTRELDRMVRLRVSRAHANDPVQRLRDDSALLAEKHELACMMEVPDAAAPISVVANLQRRSLSISMALAAPRDKQRAASRINWIVRQLAKANAHGIYVRAIWPGRAQSTQKPLEQVREDPSCLLHENGSLVPTQFEVMLVRDLAGKFSGSKKFIEELETAVPAFYAQVGQHLRAYVAAPPRIRKKAEVRESDGSEQAEATPDEATVETSEAVQIPRVLSAIFPRRT